MAIEAYSVPCVLGWANHDTGPMSLRLYALDQGSQPRHDKPFARVAEQPLMERGAAREGDRAIVVLVGDRFMSDDAFAACGAAVEQAVRAALHALGVTAAEIDEAEQD